MRQKSKGEEKMPDQFLAMLSRGLKIHDVTIKFFYISECLIHSINCPYFVLE